MLLLDALVHMLLLSIGFPLGYFVGSQTQSEIRYGKSLLVTLSCALLVFGSYLVFGLVGVVCVFLFCMLFRYAFSGRFLLYTQMLAVLILLFLSSPLSVSVRISVFLTLVGWSLVVGTLLHFTDFAPSRRLQFLLLPAYVVLGSCILVFA